jgi:hypothetical protein
VTSLGNTNAPSRSADILRDRNRQVIEKDKALLTEREGVLSNIASAGLDVIAIVVHTFSAFWL